MNSYKEAQQCGDYHDDLIRIINSADTTLSLLDHLHGFDQNLNNTYLNLLNDSRDTRTIYTEYIFDEHITKKYPNLNLKFSLDDFLKGNFIKSIEKVEPLVITRFRGSQGLFDNFLCSFSGSPHTGRLLLTSALSRFGFFNEGFCSKNFSFDIDDFAKLMDSKYRTQSLFFDPSIGNKIMTFNYDRFDHVHNYYVLSPKIIQSFVHIVSETDATSYYPFITEKFLYSVINRGLFLAYAQPGWHDHVEKHLGFKKYDKIFDYSFDKIKDPVDRLITLLTMVSKFAILSREDWRYLHSLEKETLDYNYNHFINGKYITALTKAT